MHIRLAIVGCGWAGERCAGAAMAAPLSGRVKLCAAVDVVAARARLLSERWGIPEVLDNHEDLLARTGVDAAALCLPHSLHAAVGLACLESGLDVLLEKPLAVTLAEGRALVAAAERRARVLMVAETVRFEPAFVHAAGLIREGAVGTPFLVRVLRLVHMHEFLREHPWFLTDPAGGIMMSGGIHDFEIVRMLAGEVAGVFALQAPRALAEMAGDDTSVAVARLESGAVAEVTESFSTHDREGSPRGSVHGDRGSLWFDRTSVHLLRPGAGDPQRFSFAPAGFEPVLGHFLRCVRDRCEPLTSGRDQLRPLAAVCAACDSMHSGQFEVVAPDR
ncbi:MAG: Gfo/Idh/MocA family oxidoreductase [Candidatus Latescibacterota bacterium]